MCVPKNCARCLSPRCPPFSCSAPAFRRAAAIVSPLAKFPLPSASQWNDPCYQNLSITLVQAEHPDWTNATQIFAQAELEFETAAMAWFVESLNVGKALVPQAAWGFYGYPVSAGERRVRASRARA